MRLERPLSSTSFQKLKQENKRGPYGFFSPFLNAAHLFCMRIFCKRFFVSVLFCKRSSFCNLEFIPKWEFSENKIFGIEKTPTHPLWGKVPNNPVIEHFPKSTNNYYCHSANSGQICDRRQSQLHNCLYSWQCFIIWNCTLWKGSALCLIDQ